MREPTRPPDGFFPIDSSADWGGRATRAEVNLDAIRTNVRALHASLRGARLMAVVKGDGYGHGAVPAAGAALSAGATWLGVYTVPEGVALRRTFAEVPILVFGPFQRSEARDIWEARLTPTIVSREAAESLQRTANGRTLPYHVEIDTGLTRAGIDPAEALPLMRCLGAYPGLRPQGLYTHFACADECDKGTSRRQFGAFMAVANLLDREGHTFPLKHAANSAATLDLPETHLDLVRTGISIYGYYPSRDVRRAVPLRPALSLISAATRVHRVPAGRGVGYGHEFRCRRPSTIALVPIGYGDGLPRCLGCGNGRVLVRARFAPIVGRVSMDQITIDVTDIPGVQLGDPITLIGRDGEMTQSADDLADRAGTISYEILTGLLPRVPRLYVAGGNVVGKPELETEPHVES
ncbi:MAG: alanine racemase [Chloroflexi bacterium]|nr:alanine racemase [Chloroflexota bacterium]